jgi:hypothetical protein
MKLTLDEWLAIQVGRGVLQPCGVENGIDIYHPVSHPWMEDEMKDNDPNKPCGCQPVIPANPCCEGGDDDEED